MKHSERLALKNKLSNEISALISAIQQQRKVPQSIVDGDAVSAIRWKDNREYALKASDKKVAGLSLNKLRERLEEIKLAKKASFNE